MPFEFKKYEISDVQLVIPKVFPDDRGFFLESYKKSEFMANGICDDFNQDNHSKSTKGVLRGLHYQKNPKAQAKLVRCSKGAILDVAVDIRKNSPTFGKWVAEKLTEENKHMLYIPAGFAHGFVVLSDEAEFVYKVDDYYHPNDEGGLMWNDPAIGINWPIPEDMEIKLSDKDKLHPAFKKNA